MSYPKTKPATEKEMFHNEHPGHHSICQTLRDTYRMVEDEAVKEKLRLAWAMAKKMHERLKYYKNTYEPHREDKVL